MKQKIMDMGIAQGFTLYGTLPTEKMSFEPSFRKYCADNFCGNYGKSWTCPPHLPEVAVLEAKVKAYQQAVIFQTIVPLEDSLDYEAMLEGKEVHSARLYKVLAQLRALPDFKFLAMNAGKCTVCDACTFDDNLPCRCPELAVASTSGYCVDMSDLVSKAGLKYNNGNNTVSYVGVIVF